MPEVSSQKRLFLAFAAPPSLAEALGAVQKRLKRDFGQRELGFRFTPPENFHVTLFFLGNTEKEGEVADLAAAIAGTCAPFTLEVKGIGAFPEERSARVIWAGIQRARELVELREEAERVLAPLGFIERQEFRPHLTLARLRNPHAVGSTTDSFRRTSFGEIAVTELVLYESISRIPYPEYRPMRRFPLRGVEGAALS